MTDPGTAGDLASLEPLEPLDGGAPMGGQPSEDPLQHMRAGLPAPAFNLYCRDKSFYKFLFAGVLMFVGCMMPFSAELARAGYQSIAGGFYLVIAIAMIWSWWGSIANNRPSGLKWLMFAALPLIAVLWNLVTFDAAAAHTQALAMGWLPTGITHSDSFGAMFKDVFSALAKSQEAADRASGFWRLFGPGQLFVGLGALLAELGFIGGIVGGAKKNKSDMKAKMMAAAERKRR
ncbi:MAG: hypothetical protein K8J09_07850, partial [Planctomycetes bacterium]|jgi:hypothetical protein|nr:hypothetical protein [Planctomycetota bacterium]MCC7396380.1 hypothetical protein [Planctomycetota bacterium]